MVKNPKRRRGRGREKVATMTFCKSNGLSTNALSIRIYDTYTFFIAFSRTITQWSHSSVRLLSAWPNVSQLQSLKIRRSTIVMLFGNMALMLLKVRSGGFLRFPFFLLAKYVPMKLQQTKQYNKTRHGMAGHFRRVKYGPHYYYYIEKSILDFWKKSKRKQLGYLSDKPRTHLIDWLSWVIGSSSLWIHLMLLLFLRYIFSIAKNSAKKDELSLFNMYFVFSTPWQTTVFSDTFLNSDQKSSHKMSFKLLQYQ